MSGAPSLYFPLVLPPQKGASDPTGYYAGLTTAIAVADLPNGGVDITFTNPTALHPAANFDSPVPLSTIVAPARGFMRYYPAASALPTPDGLALTLPAGLQSPDIGSLVLQLWPGDRQKIARTLTDAIPPTHLVLAGVQRLSVEAALPDLVDKLSLKLLRRSWVDAGGTVLSSSDPAAPALKAAFLQRLMNGNAEIFVTAGLPMGLAAQVEDPPGVQKGWLQVVGYAVDANNVAANTSVDDLIDGIAADARGSGNAGVFKDHPMDTTTDAPANVQFTVKAMIWDRQIRQYVPFASGTISLLNDKGVILSIEPTNPSGEATFSAFLGKRDLIAFEYDSNQKTIANRYFPSAIQTLFYKAKNYIGPNNNSECYAKYLVHPLYVDFFDQLRATTDTEKFDFDRGNSMKYNTSLASSQEDDRMSRLKDFETYYLEKPPKLPAFNVLFEGDSWLDYPLSEDIFYHLDRIFKSKVKKTHRYNAIALQHSGDRSDQMFKILDNSGEGQWKYTQDIFSEYPIDLVVLSCGGNDFAEPGISDEDQGRYAGYWVPTPAPGYFDLAAASNAQSGLGSDLAAAQRLVLASFSVLLKNHPWNRFLANKPVLPVDSGLTAKLLALGIDVGQASDSLDTIGNKIIDNFRPAFNFPPNVITPEDGFLDAIFDGARLEQRYQGIRENIETFLDLILPYTQAHGTKVVTHTYCYPMFRTAPTSVTGFNFFPKQRVTGPWFNNRFAQADILDKRVQRAALKGLIDNYVRLVLEEIKKKAAYKNMFHFADLRYTPRKDAMWRDNSYWRDEMHLRSDSFSALAGRIYDVIKTEFTTKLD